MLKEEEKTIIKYLKKDKRYSGNEDLTEKFLKEIEKNIEKTEINILSKEVPSDYVDRFVSSCIINVLKKNNRIYRVTSGTKGTKKYKSVSYDIMDYKPITEKKELLHSFKLRAVKILKDIEKEYPEKNYGEIYALRYIEKRNLSEIANILAKTEEEIAKDMFSLIEELKKRIYQ